MLPLQFTWAETSRMLSDYNGLLTIEVIQQGIQAGTLSVGSFFGDALTSLPVLRCIPCQVLIGTEIHGERLLRAA